MKLGTIHYLGAQLPVLFQADASALDLRAIAAGLPAGADFGFGKAASARLEVLDIIAAGGAGLDFCRHAAGQAGGSGKYTIAAAQAERLSPIPRTRKNVFCVGRNYVDHIKEDNVSRAKETPLPEHPQFFTKPATAIIGDGASIELDERVTRRLDYEVELAVVIGRGGRNIAAADAYNHIFGYTIVNDITARDLQRRHDQWFKGKGIDTSCPMGPWIVTRDEIADPHALRIELEVNGESRQGASTADMIFHIPRLIESLSSGMTLEPGDVIATGTPSGVGYAMDPRRFLAAGDTIVCRLQNVGTLTNTVVAVT